MEIFSDRGPQFASELAKELNKLLGVKTKLSTAYHPQTDGQTERTNQELEQYLRIFVNHRQDNWDDWLPMAEFAYNNRIHSATQHSPFYLATGRHPRTGNEPVRKTKHETAQDFVENLRKSREEATAALNKAREEMKRFADAHRDEVHEYKVGEKAWLNASNYSTDRPSKKLADKRLGPFPITEIVSSHAIRLKLPPRMKIHPVFNVTYLRPYNEPTIPGQTSKAPPPVVVQGEEQYVVENIVNSRLH
jgi:hypothetical protein